METVSSIRDLQVKLAAGEGCKIKLATSDRLLRAVESANVADKLETGIKLIPNDFGKILLAAVCEVGVVAAKAPFEGYLLGLKRKEDGFYLYFSKHGIEDGPARPVRAPREAY